MMTIGNPPKRRFLLGVLVGCTALGLTFLTHDPAIAQPPAQAGSVTGTVTDETGASVLAAQVFIQELGRGALTRANGQYTIANLPAGTYTVQVRLIGYRGQTATVSVRAGAATTQDFALAVDPLNLEGLVVTATAEPKIKLESSTAITTLSAREIEQEESRSTADLLGSVPGFYVESSGGEVNNNLFVRGLPADGSYRYVVMLEDGMPAFDANDLFFLGADNLIRIDENVERLEAVRGGNSALFGSNAPGGLVNVISKTGGPDLAGSMKLSGATGGLARYDFNVNGPIGEDWRFNVGGFYRFDDGIRDPGFPAARGGQIKANVTRLFEGGFVRVHAKYVNDRNVFYLNLPVVAEATGETRTLALAEGGTTSLPVVELTSEFAPGLPSDATLTTNDANFARIPLPQGNGEFTLPLENGVGQVGGTVKGEFVFEFPNRWEIENIVRVMRLDHENNAMPPGTSKPANEVAVDLVGPLAPGQTAEFTFVDNGQPFNTSNGLLQNATIWHVERPISNFSNQFLVKKTAQLGNTTHSFTFGSYFGHYTADHLWLFNNVLTNVQNAPRLLNLTIRDAAGDVVQQVTENGFTAFLGSPFVRAEANATLFSFFAGDEIQLTERLRIDVGGRFERDEYEANQENTTTFDLGGPSLADDAVNWGDRTFARRQVDFNEWAASVGINYLLNDQVSIYGRGSRSYKMPLLDQYATGTFPDTAETLWQAEGGVKVSTPIFGLAALAYYVRLEDFPSQDLRRDPVTGETRFETAIVGEARTIGFEFEGVAAPYPGLRLNGQFTYQDAEYLTFIGDQFLLDGNWVRRIPRVLFNVGGSYTNSGATVRAEYNFYGKRFSNSANTIAIPEFGVVSARASYTIPNQGVTLSAAVLNLLDGEGLTEGDPRVDESGVPAGFSNARPILPRRWTFAVRYDF